MNQIICRITHDDTIEMLIKERDREYFKRINAEKFLEALENVLPKENLKKRNIVLFDDVIIGVGNSCMIIKQKEHKRFVTYEKKVYCINFPNSIYIVNYDDNKIRSINAFCYKNYQGKDTILFEYPMPNMLTDNRICLGSAPKEIHNGDYVSALENIIFTQYSHSTFSGAKGFKNTIDWFEYLEKNPFPYDLLFKLKNTLGEMIRD